MGYIKSFLYEFFNTYTVDDRLITLLFASLFLPYPCTVLMIIGGTLFILIKSNYMETLKRMNGSKVLLLFAGYLLLISLLNSNWLGALLSVGIFLMSVNVTHYRRYIHRDLFDQILDIAIVLSIIGVIVAVVEQFYYMSMIDDMGFFDIQNQPQYRVHTFYFNANYYAMMILFIECMCIYKFFKIKKITFRFYYTMIGVLNLFALFLTGGRIAWLCLAVAVLCMLVFNKWYKLFIGAIASIGGAIVLLALKPGLLPRLASQGLAIGRRTKIWETAALIIQDSWLFGRGPLTYYHVYQNYTSEYIQVYGEKSLEQYKLGISSQHAHTMFLEPIVSFGVIGTIILCIYLYTQIKNIVKLFTRKIDPTLGSLLVGIIVCTFTFCIIDFPVFWIQTGLLFLLLISSFEIYSKELKA